jgi:hypothetical protein
MKPRCVVNSGVSNSGHAEDRRVCIGDRCKKDMTGRGRYRNGACGLFDSKGTC